MTEEDFLKAHYLKVDFRTRKFNKNDNHQSFKSIIRIYRLADEEKDEKDVIHQEGIEEEKTQH